MDTLPRFIAMKPVHFDTYVCYESRGGYASCRENSVFEPLTKIEVEPAKMCESYCHLRFCHSNRYWSRGGPEGMMAIVAVTKQPEEDTSKVSCTLFEPIVDGSGRVRLVHVQSGMRVVTNVGRSRLWLGLNFAKGLALPPGWGIDSYDFNYVDYDEIVMIPKSVVFKGNKGKYLKAIRQDGLPYLQFSSTDGNDGESAQEVILQSDGHVRIKSVYHGNLWRRSPNWIWADSSDYNGDKLDVMFWPVKVDDHTIALRNEGNGYFVKGLSVDNKTDCLNAASRVISHEAKLVVEELVLERSIYNVRYRMEDARVFDEVPYLAGVALAANDADTEGILTLKVSKEVTNTNSFNHNYSLKLGVENTLKAGIPLIVEGEIKISAEVTVALEWGVTKEEKKCVGDSFQFKAPPKSRARANYVGTQGKCSVPFSYTQKGRSSTDGKYVTSQHTDGIFYGVNYYSFRFEQLEVEPL